MEGDELEHTHTWRAMAAVLMPSFVPRSLFRGPQYTKAAERLPAPYIVQPPPARCSHCPVSLQASPPQCYPINPPRSGEPRTHAAAPQ